MKNASGKNGKSREVPEKKPATFYPADDIPVKTPSEREAKSRGIAKLRKSITPGTVLILLAGRFRGRRVVFLKQLESGLLLITGIVVMHMFICCLLCVCGRKHFLTMVLF